VKSNTTTSSTTATAEGTSPGMDFTMSLQVYNEVEERWFDVTMDLNQRIQVTYTYSDGIDHAIERFLDWLG